MDIRKAITQQTFDKVASLIEGDGSEGSIGPLEARRIAEEVLSIISAELTSVARTSNTSKTDQSK